MQTQLLVAVLVNHPNNGNTSCSDTLDLSADIDNASKPKRLAPPHTTGPIPRVHLLSVLQWPSSNRVHLCVCASKSNCIALGCVCMCEFGGAPYNSVHISHKHNSRLIAQQTEMKLSIVKMSLFSFLSGLHPGSGNWQRQLSNVGPGELLWPRN